MRNLIVLTILSFITVMAIAQSEFPTLEVKKLDGTSVSTDAIKTNGKLTVLSFWATWCAPCKKELDAISEVYEDWQADYDMELIAVSIDDARMVSRVKPMVTTKGWPFEVWVDSDQTLKEALQFQTVPFTCLLDQEGNIVYKHSGYLPGDEVELEDKLAALAN